MKQWDFLDLPRPCRTIRYKTEGGTFAIDACELRLPRKTATARCRYSRLTPPARAFGHLAVDSTPVLRFRGDWMYHLVRTNIKDTSFEALPFAFSSSIVPGGKSPAGFPGFANRSSVCSPGFCLPVGFVRLSRAASVRFLIALPLTMEIVFRSSGGLECVSFH